MAGMVMVTVWSLRLALLTKGLNPDPGALWADKTASLPSTRPCPFAHSPALSRGSHSITEVKALF